MTGGRIYWPLGRIVTFRATIYDDWNGSGQSRRPVTRAATMAGREGRGKVTKDERDTLPNWFN